MLNQFTISIGVTILAMGMVHVILISQYDCTKVQESFQNICYNGRLNLGFSIDVIIGILGTPLIVQGYRNLEPKNIEPKTNSIGLIDGVEGS